MDYKDIGFKCGLEIHQQLDTKKLFCECSSIVHDANPDILISRKLRPVTGETGDIDKAVLFEKSKSKEFIYEACGTSCCLVELDEEPPHMVNQDALNITLEVALLLNAKIVDEFQFMRKTVIDGSNVSGFQRTALIGLNGYINTSKGKVNIESICLEEESAKKIEETTSYVKYRLDRLGIPLIEIATDASIKDPEHAKEVAEKLGMMLRSTGKVKRGLGTIRQDVNVSIKSGARTEIKGFQDLRSIPKVIDYEINRQLKEIKAGNKIQESVRKSEANFTTSYLRPMPGAARMYPETSVISQIISKDQISKIKIPELIDDKIKNLEKYKISPDLAKNIIKIGKLEYFTSLFNEFKNLKPLYIVDTFIGIRNQLEKEYKIKPEKVADDQIEIILDFINKEKLSKGNLLEAIRDIVNNKFRIEKFKKSSKIDIESQIKKIIEDNPNLSMGAYMGIIMSKFKGKVDGNTASEILKKLL